MEGVPMFEPSPVSPDPAAAPLPPVLTLAAIIAEHGPFVWRTVRRLGVRPGEVEDVAQEVFLVVHRRLADYDGRSGMRAWLYGICTKKGAEHRRRAWFRREQPVAETPETPVAPDQSDSMERRDARAQLEAILAELDTKKRDVFVLFELEEMSLAEVAAAVGCPLQTAYSRLHAARSLVQASIARLHARGDKS
jgi:RNA polymerase sigma-70 factor (ECF subfamily)